MKTRSDHGFAVIELVILVVLVGVLGFVGWRVYQSHQTASVTSSVASSTPSYSAVPRINNTAQLNDVEQTLDSTNVDDSSLNDLDSALNF